MNISPVCPPLVMSTADAVQAVPGEFDVQSVEDRQMLIATFGMARPPMPAGAMMLLYQSAFNGSSNSVGAQSQPALSWSGWSAASSMTNAAPRQGDRFMPGHAARASHSSNPTAIDQVKPVNAMTTKSTP